MAVTESWKDKSGGTGSGTRMPRFETWKSTRPIFKDLSELGLCRRTAMRVHGHLQPLARHGNAPVSIQVPSQLRDAPWYSI